MYAPIKFGDIVKRVRRQVGDDFAGRIGDRDIRRWVNSAQREIVTTNNLLQKTAYIQLVPEVSKYDFPQDIHLLHSISYDGLNLVGLQLKEFQDLNKDNEGVMIGKPLNFTVWAGKLRIHPTPPLAAQAPGQLEVYYTRRPTSLEDEDYETELDLPDLYEERIVEYCLAQVAEMDEDREGYAMKMQEFQVGVANLKDETEWWQRDAYPGIAVSPDDYDHIYSGVYW